MTVQTLYLQQQTLEGPLTVGALRKHIAFEIAWFSLEPRPSLPVQEGKMRTGRIPGLAPLDRQLPQGLDDLPLLSASLYGERRWLHLHDAHPLSRILGSILTWSMDPMEGAQEIPSLAIKNQDVLTWQDRKRFGFEEDSSLPQTLQIEHFFRAGRRLTWRIACPNAVEKDA